MYTAKSHIIFKMVGADRTLLSLAVSWLLLAWLTFFCNIHLILRNFSNWYVLVWKILINLAHIRHAVWSDISYVIYRVAATILNDLLLVRRKSKHWTRDSTCCSKAIVPSLEARILVRVIAWRPHSHMVGGRTLCLLWHLYLSIVLRLLHGMSSRRVNFPLNNAIALSDILRTAAIIEICILLVHLISWWDPWGIGIDLIALCDLVGSKLGGIPLLRLSLILVLANNWNVIWILWRWWHFQ